MAYDFFNSTFTGNLTAEATTHNFEDKMVFNFTVANNSSLTKTTFINCSYWISKKATDDENSPVGKLIETLKNGLKKGVKVTVSCSGLSIDKSEGKDNTVYHNPNFNVDKIVIH